MVEKIVIVANADSFWVQRYISKVSIPLKQKITIVSASNKQYRQYYENHGIDVITTKTDREWLRGRKVNALKVSIKTVMAINSADPTIVHIHYAYRYILRLLPFIKRRFKQIITFWGSDLLRASEKELRLIVDRASKADALVVGAEDLYDKLISLDTSFEKKTEIIRMGLTAFDVIDKKRDKVAEARIRVLGNRSKGMTVLTIGYNAGKAQQHIQILEKISELPYNIKKMLIIVLPLTYKNDDTDYLKKVKVSLDKTGIKGIILTAFMNDDQIADLCLSTDVFVNAQTTDAISASMLEHIYAGSIVLNGDWLKYDFLDRNNIQCMTFANFDNFNERLVEILKKKRNSYDVKKASLTVKENFSWKSSREKWQKVYKNLQ